ncbi:MAG: hypothetical protein ACRDF4_02960, partial [Rhabdochlamydiaceae bacterium]
LVPNLVITIPAMHSKFLTTSAYVIPMSTNFTSHTDVVATVIVFTALVFIGFTTNPLTHRTKYWALLAILISTLSVLLSGSFKLA